MIFIGLVQSKMKAYCASLINNSWMLIGRDGCLLSWDIRVVGLRPNNSNHRIFAILGNNSELSLLTLIYPHVNLYVNLDGEREDFYYL